MLLDSAVATAGRPFNFRLYRGLLSKATARRWEEREFGAAREIFFTATVPALFPEEAAAIIGPAPLSDPESDSRRLDRFVSHFDERYFPIHDCDPEWIGQGLHHVTEAWEEWRWEQVWESPGEVVLVLAILGREWEALQDRTAWGELRAACPTLPEEPPSALPAAPLSEEQAARAFAGTPYAALAGLIRWMAGETGSPFLDTNSEWGMDTTFDPNDLGVVRELAESWRTVAVPLLDAVEALTTLIATDPAWHLTEILAALAAAAIPTGARVGP